MKYVLGVMLILLAGHATAGEIEWRTDFEVALEEAVLERKPLLITFYTKWCGWCRKLEQTTFRDPTFIERLEEYYVPVRLDGDQNRGITTMFQVRAFPTTLLLTRNADEIGRILGYQTPADFSKILLIALNHRETSYDALQAKVKESPADPEVLYAWGDVLMALNRYQEAAGVFRTIMEGDASAEEWKSQAHLDLAIAVWKHSGAVAAAPLFASFLEEYPGSDRLEHAFLQYGKALLEMGEEKQGRAMLERAAHGGSYVREQAIRLTQLTGP